MKEAEYPVTPTKLRENQSSQSYVGRFLSNPQSNVGSTRPADHSGTRVQYDGAMSPTQNRGTGGTVWRNKNFQLENKNLGFRNENLHNTNNRSKARLEQFTPSCDHINTGKTRSDKEYKDIVFKMIMTYASGKGLNFDDLTNERVQETCNTISSEAEASEHLRAQLRYLGAQTETLRKDPMASRLRCQSLEERQSDPDAKLQESPQNLELCQDEAQGLRAQVQALQKEMLAQVPNNEVITDEVFSRDFHALASLVKSLSRSVQPAQNIDILDVLKPHVLLHGVSQHHWDTRARKKAYVEAWIWSLLIDTVFQYSFGFCENLIALHKNWRFIFRKDWISKWPKPSPESETWRFTTATKLVREIGREMLIAGQNHRHRHGPNAHARRLQKEVLERREYVANMIKLHLTAVAPASRLSHISEVVNKAFELALNMSLQRFRVQVTWPNIGEKFEANRMTAFPERNDEDIHEGIVAFTVNPGLTRWGNAHGQNFDVCHDIVPALVQLEPVQTRRRDSHVLIPIKRKS